MKFSIDIKQKRKQKKELKEPKEAHRGQSRFVRGESYSGTLSYPLTFQLNKE